MESRSEACGAAIACYYAYFEYASVIVFMIFTLLSVLL